MESVNSNEIVACYWAIGPSYRTYLTKNIKKLMEVSSEMFNFIILTDNVDDPQFIELKNSTEKCLAILDVDLERKDYSWSFEYEPLPQAKTDPEYGNEFKQNLINGKRFSYSLHRFVLPWLIRNNVTKFFMIDPDVHLKLHNFDTLQEYVDVMLYPQEGKHNVILNSRISHGQNTPSNLEPYECGTSRVVGVRPAMIRDSYNDNIHDLACSVIGETEPYPEMYPQLDGQIKYYDFDTVQSLQKFFDVWNEARRLQLLPENQSTWGIELGPVIMNDEVLLGGLFFMLKINVYAWQNGLPFYLRPRLENRWFEVSWAGFVNSPTLEQSIEDNRHMYEHDLYDFSHIYEVKDAV